MSYLALRLVVLMRDAPSSVTGFARATFPPRARRTFSTAWPSPSQGEGGTRSVTDEGYFRTRSINQRAK